MENPRFFYGEKTGMSFGIFLVGDQMDAFLKKLFRGEI